MLRVFFSYTSHYEQAKDIVSKLEADFEDEWKDRGHNEKPKFENWLNEGVPPGENLLQYLEKGIEASNVFVAIICPKYAKKIARKEIEKFAALAGEKRRLIPILLANKSETKWDDFQEIIDISNGEYKGLRWCYLREEYIENKLTMAGRDELRAACKAAVTFLLDTPPPPPDPAAKRPGVVVMGKPNGEEDAAGAREALAAALAGKVPEGETVDLGDDWNSEESVDGTLALLQKQTNATDLCLVSVRSSQQINDLIDKVKPDGMRKRLAADFAYVAGMLDTFPAPPRRRNLVWLAGDEAPELEDSDGVHFVRGDVTAVSRQVLREIGAIGACPFLLEEGGDMSNMTAWSQHYLAPKLFEPPEAAPIPQILDMKQMSQKLREFPEDRRGILAITDKGLPSKAKILTEDGEETLRKHIRNRMEEFERLIESVGTSRSKNTFRLLFQIGGHRHIVSNSEALRGEAGPEWYILRVNPGERKLIDESSEADKYRQKIRRFMAGETV